MSSSLVSIITPSYNAEGLIGRTIQSVLEQSYPDWEMIIIDDCSKDGTCDVVREYAKQDSRIRLVALEKNNGAPAAPRNIGVSKAKGEWIAFLDADDIWHPQKLMLQMQALGKYGKSFTCSRMKDFSDDAVLSFPTVGSVECEFVTFERQRLKGRIPTSSVVLRKELMVRFPFNEDIRYKAVEDYHCWLRIHQSIESSVKLQYPLLSYRRIAGQISGSKTYMLKRIYMVHHEYPQTNKLQAAFFTATHALGGFYYRTLRKGL
jgi:teichuronic acid biosynthesis glycosyltransferase TuaG